MNYATIGTSWITEKFISAANCVEDMKLYAVYSRNEDTAKVFAEKHGAEKYFSSLEDLANDKNTDSVYIASPNVFHFEQSKFLLEHSKNVICEKPATTTKEQMEYLIKLAEEKNLVYTEAIMSIHTSAFDTLKGLLPEIGRIRSVNLNFCQLSSKYPAYLEGKNPNIFNPEMHTGCLMDIGVYNLYITAALFGEPDKILSDAHFLESGADSNGCAIFSYEDKSVSLLYSKTGQNFAPSEIIGDKGTISIDSISQLTGIDFISKETKYNVVPYDVDRDTVMSGEARFFKDMVQSKDFSNPKYIFATQTALTVRKMCDIIRRQNSFPF